MEKKCKGCGKDFEAKFANKMYCERACMKKSPGDRLSKLIPQEVLIDLSVNQVLSNEEIGKRYGVCGTIIWRYLKYLGIKNDKGNRYIGDKNKKWKGYEGLSGKIWGRILTDAKKRNIEVKITIEEAWNQYLKQQGKCNLSGVKIPLDAGNYKSDYKEKSCEASLDRIDSSIGYQIDNIQWVHKKINLMKNIISNSEFIEFCKLISNYNTKVY